MCFLKTIPSNEDIDNEYANDYEDKTIPKHRFAQDKIIDSMTTEYGRGTGWYGDCGRYVFQSNFSNWSNINIDKLSNYAVEIIFNKFGYDAEKHGEFDRNTPIQVVVKIELNELAKNISGWQCMKW